VTSPLTVALVAASSAVDTDWTAKLIDVSPDGYARNVQEGIVRASHRIAGAVPTPIEPGKTYEYTIDLWAASNVFLAGHRIRLEISSSNFPHWNRNLNSGEPLATGQQIVIAQQTVFHDSLHASHIMLPVIDQ